MFHVKHSGGLDNVSRETSIYVYYLVKANIGPPIKYPAC
jgi:hypothetical protein